MQTIWIDAAEFENKGGWKTETQFVRSVGSAYLLGVGKPGTPVENATTSFKVNEDGYYRFFVRTKNWKFPEAPGQFTLSADGQELPNILGKMPTHKWYWEIAGDAYLKKGEHTLSAIDKTGWLARFASVVITNDMDFTPSPEIERFLKQRADIKGISTKPEELHFDYVVVGAGPAGTPAAIEAARNGLKVALISGRPAIGGNASNEGTIGLGTVRVESTLATLGQATGAAAYLCKKYGTNPRGIYENHIKELQQLLLRHDLTIPGIVNEDEKDLARTAKVSASSCADDVYILKTSGVRDVWVPLTTKIYSGPYCHAATYPAEFYKAELKNLSDEEITLKAYLLQYNQKEDINETIEKIDECEIILKPNCEEIFDLPFREKSKMECFAVSFEVNPNVAWRKRIYVTGGSAVVYYLENGKIVQHPRQGMELHFNSELSLLADTSPENVINGINRPLDDELNGWVSKKGLPASLTLTLKEAKKISEVRITTRVELTYPQYCFTGDTISIGTANDVTVSVRTGENWTEVAHIKDNVKKQMVATFDPILAQEVKITVNKSIADNSAHITEVRIYE